MQLIMDVLLHSADPADDDDELTGSDVSDGDNGSDGDDDGGGNDVPFMSRVSTIDLQGDFPRVVSPDQPVCIIQSPCLLSLQHSHVVPSHGSKHVSIICLIAPQVSLAPLSRAVCHASLKENSRYHPGSCWKSAMLRTFKTMLLKLLSACLLAFAPLVKCSMDGYTRLQSIDWATQTSSKYEDAANFGQTHWKVLPVQEECGDFAMMSILFCLGSVNKLLWCSSRPLACVQWFSLIHAGH